MYFYNYLVKGVYAWNFLFMEMFILVLILQLLEAKERSILKDLKFN